MQLSAEELQKRFKELPEALREAIFSAEIAETLLSIGKKYALSLERVGDLSTETSLVMLGVTHPKEYISQLQQELGVERDVAKNIAQEVNEQVFSKIREELKKLHNIKDETEEKGGKAPVPAPAQPQAQTQQEPYPHRDLSPMPPITRKPYAFADLQKQVEKQTAEKKDGDLLPMITLPQLGAQKQMEETKKEAPKTPSPFEQKIKDGVFRQEPAESTKIEASKTPEPQQTTSYPRGAADPYRQPIAPEETSFDLNPRITKDK